MVTPNLQGLRVELRPFEPADDSALHEILRDARLAGRRNLPHKYDPWIPPSREQTAAIREDWVSREHGMCLAACDPSSGAVVGYGFAGWGWDPHCPWTHVVVAPDRWRQGLGTAMMQLLLDFLFGTTVAHVITGDVDEWNQDGVAFTASLGFQPSGRYRRNGVKDGRFFDTLAFDLLRREWLALRRSGADGT